MVDSNSPVGEALASPQRPPESSPADGHELLDVRRAYAIGARRRHQRKIADLIPKRPLAYSATIGALACLLITLNLLAYFSPTWQSIIGAEGVAALAMTGPTSVTTWFATIFFAITAAMSLQIYAMRQHRSDDYEGSYRIWGWLAIAFGFASLACVVPVTAIAQNIFSAVSGRAFATTWLPAAIGITCASLLLVRYLMEVRTSYGAVAWAGIAWFAICLRVSTPEMLSSVLPDSIGPQQSASLAWGNGLFLVAASTLLANLTYARFVFLRANGFIAAKPKQIKKIKKQDLFSISERFARKRAERRAAKKKLDQQPATAQTSTAAPKSSETVAKRKPKATNKTKATSSAKAKPQKAKRSSPAKSTSPAKVTEKPVRPEPQPEILKMSTASLSNETANPTAKTISDSASARLKQLADAARAKSAATEAGTDSEFQPAASNKKLSKAEKRRQRKLQRQQKRAA
jgi:hypothetical protein